MAFDGIYLARNFGQNSGGIARTRADLEHLFAPLECQGLDHVGHDIGLRNGLTGVDGQGTVPISLTFQAVRHETFARHSRHRIQNQRIAHPARLDLTFDHFLAKIIIARHVRSPLRPSCDWRISAIPVHAYP